MIAVGTRFFGQSVANDLPRLERFVEAAREIGPVFVAVNNEQDKTGAVLFFKQKDPPGVEVFPVTPWGKFVPALNAIVYKAALVGADQLLLASVEFPPTEEMVEVLGKHLDDITIVVGAKTSMHEFCPGQVVEGTGVRTPMNTFSLWNMKFLARFGFPLAGDAPFNPEMAGVEKIVAISLYQQMYKSEEGKILKAKLVQVPGIGDWDTTGWDEARLEKHQAKIVSKNERPAAQLAWAKLPTPMVWHIA